MENDAGVDARLTSDWISAVASLATLVVVAITAYAAIRQMRHMRSGNQVAALLPLIEQYRSPEMQASMQYLLQSLNDDLKVPENRAGIVAVPAAGPCRRAMAAVNFYESCGALVCAGVIDLELLLRYFILPSEIWQIAGTYVVLSRESRGDEVFENLEAMVALEKKYAQHHGTSLYPKGLSRVPPEPAL